MPQDTPHAPLSRHEIAAIADRVEEALAGSKAGLWTFHQELVQRLQDGMRELPQEARKAILGLEPSSPVYAAFLLGQLSFAQNTVAQAYVRRADDDFEQVLSQPENRPLVQDLLALDMSTGELAERIGISQSEANSRLRVLREKGITDFRQIGPQVINFLTPAGREVAQTALGRASAQA